MVSGVEDLVATAERECGRMQARLFPVAFIPYVHVSNFEGELHAVNTRVCAPACDKRAFGASPG